MLGSMQDWPLRISRLIDFAAQNHGDREVVTATVEGPLHRSNWRTIHHRTRQLAQALTGLGVAQGDRVATLAWNTHRHLEAWYAATGMGAVIHTVNPRLFAEQLVYIINHAEDRVLLFDLSFVKLVAEIAPRLTSVRHFILMTDRAHMPADPDLLCYEELLDASDGTFVWADVPETAPAALCYTSGTTGNPKGVLYSHRSTVLHCYGTCMVDAMALSSRTCVLPIVPMYHANAWGIPYAAAAVGAKLVMGGSHFDAATLRDLIVDEGVSFTAAVPTIWLGMLQHLTARDLDLGGLKTVLIGGSAAPRSMIQTFQDRFKVEVIHAWGMTEMSPLGTLCTMTHAAADLAAEAQLDLRCKQGHAIFGVELRITDDDGTALPHDGRSAGHLLVRGPWIVERYFKGDGGEVLDGEGWFDTGDVATIDPHGYMQITDRAKDVIKSGGEWISSIELENLAVGHPCVAEAAVIGIAHPRWGERPLLIVVRREGADLTRNDMLAFLQDKVARWWLPDDVAFADALPHTATGKISKLELRNRFRDHRLPDAVP